MNTPMDSSIARGVAFLRTVQCSDGRFDSFASPTKRPFAATQTYPTTFTPAIILNALCRIHDTDDIRTLLCTWLMAQKSPAWSFNYWAMDTPQRTYLPYPDDLHDTFCALLALRRHRPELIDAATLGHAVRLLLATEQGTGGPYRTWLVAENAPTHWKDVDLAANSNIAYFLQLVAQPLPNLTRLMDEAIASENFNSSYYPSPYPLFYYVARAYRGGLTQQLAAHILKQRKEGHWGSPLRTALALSALHELGKTDGLDTATMYLLSQQEPDGSWPAEAFCFDPVQNGQQYYSGAPALTTALVLEALQFYVPRPLSAVVRMQTSPGDSASNDLYNQVITEAKKRLSALDPTLRRQSLIALDRIVKSEHNREIVLLPYFFAQSLRGSAPPPITALLRLGLANLYGWMAYTIYDDFLDAAVGAQQLPAATVSLRYSLQAFRTVLPDSPAFQQIVLDTFDTIDGANAWEVLQCRLHVDNQQAVIGLLPRYGALQRLAQRSLGHALTPLGVLASVGIPPTSPAAQQLLRALKHYLIARQLHDDLHDWETDLHAGQCSYVVARILAGLHTMPGPQPLDELVPRMRHEFWHHTLPAVGQFLLRHVAMARRDIRRSGLLTSHNSITQLLDTLEAAVSATLTEQSDAKTFLEAYRAPPKT